MKTETIKVPHFEGFKCLGYLVPRAGQYIWVHGESPREIAVDFMDTKLLTYEKLPPKRHVFEETGEYRTPQKGDYYLFENHIFYMSNDEESLSSYTILRKVDE